MNYQKHYNNLINRANNRIIDSYTEKHHIIPRCIGGQDSIENLVKLTPEEHYVAHQLLIKIYPNEPKMVLAARYMTNGNKKNGGRINNKMYGWIKKRFSLAMAELSSGKKQSSETIEKRKESRQWYKHSDETKEKISESNKGKHNFTHTEESKKKISQSQIGRPSGMLGKTHSAETKNKISAYNKGKTISDTQRKKISDAKIGVKFSEDHKQKLSKSSARKGQRAWNRGIPHTNEVKEKMGAAVSKALKGRTWEDLYGIEGAQKRRENLRLKRLSKQDT